MKRILFVLLFIPTALSAQTEWARSSGNIDSFGLEGVFPSLKTVGYNEVTGYGLFASGRIQLPGVTLVVEIPYVSGTQKYSPPGFSMEQSKTSLGNIFAGVEFGGSGLTTGFGVRLPVMKEEGILAAAAMGVVDFLTVERYLPKAMSVVGSVSVNPGLADQVRLHLSAGPVFWIPVPKEGRDTEVLLDYEGGLAVAIGPLSVAAGITGRLILTEDRLLGDKKTAHAFQGEIGSSYGLVHPSLFYRIPLGQEEISDVVSSIIGVVVVVTL